MDERAPETLGERATSFSFAFHILATSPRSWATRPGATARVEVGPADAMLPVPTLIMHGAEDLCTPLGQAQDALGDAKTAVQHALQAIALSRTVGDQLRELAGALAIGFPCVTT